MSCIIRNGNLKEELEIHANVLNSVLSGLEEGFTKSLSRFSECTDANKVECNSKELEIYKKLEKQIEEDHVEVIKLSKLKEEKVKEVEELTQLLKEERLKVEANRSGFFLFEYCFLLRM